MKGLIILCGCMLLSVLTMACSGKSVRSEMATPSAAQSGTKDKNKVMNKTDKVLVVFFSHTGENYAVGNITEGNTHIIADMIRTSLKDNGQQDVDIFEIKPAVAYPENYDTCIDVAKKELQRDARPAIKDDIDISKYDTIFLGYPNWWGQPPMCVFTFIEGHDWNGKTVIPFITHEGSGMGGTDRKIAQACKGADVMVGKGLAVRGATAQNEREKAKKSVEAWLEKL